MPSLTNLWSCWWHAPWRWWSGPYLFVWRPPERSGSPHTSARPSHTGPDTGHAPGCIRRHKSSYTGNLKFKRQTLLFVSVAQFKWTTYTPLLYLAFWFWVGHTSLILLAVSAVYNSDRRDFWLGEINWVLTRVRYFLKLKIQYLWQKYTHQLQKRQCRDQTVQQNWDDHWSWHLTSWQPDQL